MANSFFLDTAFAIALISPKDVFHEKALELAKQIEKTKTRLVTTRAIVIEIGNALSKEKESTRRYGKAVSVSGLRGLRMKMERGEVG